MTRHSLRLLIACTTLAVVSALTATSAANAADYAPTPGITVSNSTPAPGSDVQVVFKNGTFPGNNGTEPVAVSIAGYNASLVTGTVAGSGAHFSRGGALPLLGRVSTVRDAVGFTQPAVNAGLAFTMTLPSDSTGYYTVTGTGTVSGSSISAQLSVTVSSSGKVSVSSSSSAVEGTGGGLLLALTGASGVLLLGLAIGAGTLLIVGIILVVAARRRRRRLAAVAG